MGFFVWDKSGKGLISWEREGLRKMVFRVKGASGERRGSTLGGPLGGVPRGWGGEWSTGDVDSKRGKGSVGKE